MNTIIIKMINNFMFNIINIIHEEFYCLNYIEIKLYNAQKCSEFIKILRVSILNNAFSIPFTLLVSSLNYITIPRG